ncbi:MAG: DEAD/DEAH box helicase [Candidatus Omnitrophica bacterium]|nr:DEAD/DEAH box helicase [Candidatus Omnitrophota bacterium]MDD5352090.1 DEAD/DEAH box helicase [Candidatus Omnitrophota bacterium]MDD5549688.1 DEAD/DEAH box helicase [Candidatus Omnitrophota bacterium]
MMNKSANIANVQQVASQPNQGFYGLGIAPKILDILERIKFNVPTPIQLKAIPLAIEGKDIIGIAQTGTGKTHSFAIPMVQRLAQKKGTGLVLAPTRELAIQIDEAFRGIAYSFGMRTACLIGGAPMPPQVQALRKNPRIVIATPGRLLDHMRRWNILTNDVIMLVLDEADRMLDMGFAPQIEQILRFLPKERQTMLFSATIPKEIMAIAAKYMKLPVSVEIAPSGTIPERVTQELFIVKKDAKLRLLGKLLMQYHGSILLFSRTKHNARKITVAIRNMGHRAAEIHSDRSLNQRREALEGFKSGKYKVLVATDIAARGIDVTGIELVINYDLPEDTENYVHRIGRTGRVGHKGHAISFATPDQSHDVRDIERLIRTTLPISRHPEFSTEQFIQSPHRPSYRQSRHNYGQRRNNFHRHKFSR